MSIHSEMSKLLFPVMASMPASRLKLAFEGRPSLQNAKRGIRYPRGVAHHKKRRGQLGDNPFPWRLKEVGDVDRSAVGGQAKPSALHVFP